MIYIIGVILAFWFGVIFWSMHSFRNIWNKRPLAWGYFYNLCSTLEYQINNYALPESTLSNFNRVVYKGETIHRYIDASRYLVYRYSHRYFWPYRDTQNDTLKFKPSLAKIKIWIWICLTCNVRADHYQRSFYQLIVIALKAFKTLKAILKWA